MLRHPIEPDMTRRHQVHTQRPIEVDVLRGDTIIGTVTATFTVQMVYEGEVPDLTDWRGRFIDAPDDLDRRDLVGHDGIMIRLPLSGLSGQVLVGDDLSFVGTGPAPVEVPTK